ncbi:MAG: hypothetical protein KBT33_00390 [Prevotellaceae bacterium]|nr:hypothetical protein [Candidatus Minthosoma equi]
MHEIWKYTLDDAGKVVASEAITKNSKKTNARPFVIEGTQNAKDGADRLRLTWMNGDYYYWIVNTTYKQAYPTSIMAECAMPVNETNAEGTTISIDLAMNASNYTGDQLKFNNDIVWGVNSKQYSYVRINGKEYTSQNVLGTADSWQTENTGTTGGTWLSKTKLGKFNLTMTADGKYLTIYRNGIIDQKIEYAGSVSKAKTAGGATIEAQELSANAATQSSIKNNMRASLDKLD